MLPMPGDIFKYYEKGKTSLRYSVQYDRFVCLRGSIPEIRFAEMDRVDEETVCVPSSKAKIYLLIFC